MALQSLGRIGSESLAKHADLRRKVDATRVLLASKQAIEGLWGSERAAFARPATFQEGELKIAATSSVVVGELKREEVRILNEVNRMLGARVVRSIKVVQG